MLSKEELRDVKGNKCFWCGVDMLAIPMDKERRLSKQDRYRIKTMDHVIAKSKGGGVFCVSSCGKCNSMKGNMHPREFRNKYRLNVNADLLERLIEHALELSPRWARYSTSLKTNS